MKSEDLVFKSKWYFSKISSLLDCFEKASLYSRVSFDRLYIMHICIIIHISKCSSGHFFNRVRGIFLFRPGRKVGKASSQLNGSKSWTAFNFLCKKSRKTLLPSVKINILLLRDAKFFLFWNKLWYKNYGQIHKSGGKQ